MPFAMLAKQFGKEFYVAGSTMKITDKIEIEQRDPKEIISPTKLKGAKIINPAFDVTPSEFITSIITEKGVLKPHEIVRLS